MSFCEILSHPGIPLESHLLNVADLCKKKFSAHANTRVTEYFDTTAWQDLVWMMGFCHDLGKATSFFQEYLVEEDEIKKATMRGKDNTSHALLSAVIAHFICKKFVGNKPCDHELWQAIPFFIFIAIKRHHGNLNNAVKMNNTDDDNELDIKYDHIDIQFAHIPHEILEHYFSFINKRCDLALTKNDFPKKFGDYYKSVIYREERRRIKRMTSEPVYYFIFQYLFSILIQSDKEDAIFKGDLDLERRHIRDDIVKDYIEKNFGHPKSRMNKLRRDIFNEADQTLDRTDLVTRKIFSLNVPTGSGKTFTCLSLALKLRKRMEKEHGVSPRVIYCLPFTSIIDQNHEVFKSILGNPDSDILIKHHHLSDIFYMSGGDEYDTNKSKFLIESWESEIIVTTMFQLFHTLLTNRNRMLIKFEKLVNAVVLCDEIQSLPYKYWELARSIMSCFSTMFNTCFILVTATQPRLFESDEITELVPQKNRYFAAMNRVSIEFNKNQVTLAEYKNICQQAIARYRDQSFLFVMNTVNSALELFESLAGIDSDADYFFLATNIIPKDRIEVISNIKKTVKRKIIVSTQMVEAGVDIDIDNVWRDMAPLESINQVCGRCNRNFTKPQGTVRIFQILNEEHNNTPFEKYIYGKNPLSIDQTRQVIAGKASVDETQFLENMDDYYTEIKKRLRDEDSQKILEYISNLQFLSVYKNFKLIEEENYERKDIFIEINQKAADTWNQFIEIKGIANTLERKTRFLGIKKSFYDYMISVPATFVKEKEFEETNIVYVNREMLPGCYDKTTGWIRKDQGVYTL